MDIDELLMCSCCLDKFFNLHYSMVNATWLVTHCLTHECAWLVFIVIQWKFGTPLSGRCALISTTTAIVCIYHNYNYYCYYYN